MTVGSSEARAAVGEVAPKYALPFTCPPSWPSDVIRGEAQEGGSHGVHAQAADHSQRHAQERRQMGGRSRPKRLTLGRQLLDSGPVSGYGVTFLRRKDGGWGFGFRRGRWCGGGSHALPLGPGLRRGDGGGSFRFLVGMTGVWPGMMGLSGAR